MNFLLRLVTWWNSQTVGTQYHTWRHGMRVGEDALGNVYYQSRDGKRRWVIYAAEMEASTISPDWHGWLHHTWDETPTDRPYVRKPWEKPHVENRTGTPEAYRPAGSLNRPPPAVRRDYEAWTPE
jgi:NADH:ubiquinone oxidoreductase subunit